MTEPSDSRPDGAGSGGPPDAMSTLYSLRDVARLTGASADQLRYWNRNGMLPARARQSGGLWYGFPDVVAARTAVDLINKGVSTRKVREAIEALRDLLPDVAQPLASLRVVADHGKLMVHLDEALVEPSGQVMLDLPMSPLVEAAGEVIAVRLPPPSVRPEDEPQDADGWLQSGLDAESRGDPERAEMAYRRALSLEPTHPGALLNLGNLVYARGKLRPACELYRAATRAAPDYPQAWYNLANVLDDLEHQDAAARAYRTAVALDDTYADAHFNLALMWEKQARPDLARPHWLRYLELEPEHPSAEIARRFVQASDEA